MRSQIVSSLTVLALVGLLTGSQADAEEAAMSGYGGAPCAKINADVPLGTGWGKDIITHSIMSWMQGFIAGSNYIAMRATKNYYNLGTISNDEQWGYVMDYCRRNPDKQFFQAVLDLMVKRLGVLPVEPAR
jgi:hypothetical protein